MGIYMFKSKYADYVKVGHTTHENPWHRLDGSCGVPPGFDSIRHPISLEGRVSMKDLELVGWWPEITIAQERAIHTIFANSGIVGEWYPLDMLDIFYAIFRANFGSSKHESIRVPEKPFFNEPEPKPVTSRAMKLATSSKAKPKAKKGPAKDPKLPKRHGERWEEKEDEQLRSRSGHHWKTKSVVDFVAEDAKWRERTTTSVRSRMKKLGLVSFVNNEYVWTKSLEEEE